MGFSVVSQDFFSSYLFQLKDATQFRRRSEKVHPRHSWKLSLNNPVAIFR